MKYKNQTFQAGFTLLEFLIAMALTIMLAASALPLYGNLQWTAQLNEIEARTVGELRLARELSSARSSDSQYGIYFDVNPVGADRIIFFRGASYAARNPSYDRITALSDILTLQAALAGGETEIVFSKNFGIPSVIGTITLTHSGSGDSRVISINAYGMVDVQ